MRERCRHCSLSRVEHADPAVDHGFNGGDRCTECGFTPGPTSDWFRCGDERFCSIECAVQFLLRREEIRE